jgi:hypothetical protein
MHRLARYFTRRNCSRRTFSASACRPVELQQRFAFTSGDDATVEQREHHPEHARIGVDAANRRASHPGRPEPPHIALPQSVGRLPDQDVTRSGLEPQLAPRSARFAGRPLQGLPEKRARRIHELRENPALEALRVTADPFAERFRRVEPALEVDDHQCMGAIVPGAGWPVVARAMARGS